MRSLTPLREPVHKMEHILPEPNAARNCVRCGAETHGTAEQGGEHLCADVRRRQARFERRVEAILPYLARYEEPTVKRRVAEVIVHKLSQMQTDEDADTRFQVKSLVCDRCKQPIISGQEAKKVVYQDPDGTVGWWILHSRVSDIIGKNCVQLTLEGK